MLFPTIIQGQARGYGRINNFLSALTMLSIYHVFHKITFFNPALKNKIQAFLQNAPIRRQIDKNAWNQLKMATKIPDFHILKKLINKFTHVLVARV